jgi:hypothetical protein
MLNGLLCVSAGDHAPGSQDRMLHEVRSVVKYAVNASETQKFMLRYALMFSQRCGWQ